MWMKKGQKRTIQHTLLRSHVLLTIAVIFVCVTVFGTVFVNELRRQMAEAQLSLCQRVAEQLEVEVDRMDDAAKRLIFSMDIKKLFYAQLPEDRTDLIHQNQLNLAEKAIMMTGVIYQVKQINLIDEQTRSISIAGNTRVTEREAGTFTVDWDRDLSVYPMRRMLLAPRKSSDGSYVVSLVRNFAPPPGRNMDSYVEIQQSYDVFEDILLHSTAAFGDLAGAFLFDEAGDLIYPAEPDDTLLALTQKLYRELENPGSVTSRFVADGMQVQTVAAAQLESVHWQLILLQSLPIMEQSTGRWAVGIVLCGALLAVIASAVSVMLSRKLATPIVRVHDRILSMNPVTLYEGARNSQEENETILELQELNDAFSEMMDSLRKSADETVLARSALLQAKLLALQAQMNPHFLYNTLNAISVMAEDEGALQTVDMIMALSQMLTYLTNGDIQKPVALDKELDYTMNFIALMKIRYEDAIDVQVDIPEDMRRIRIPKLVMQPFVENWSKYGMVAEGQSRLRICGKLEGGHWLLRIEDNGPGFDTVVLDQLHREIKDFAATGKIPDLKINKMGLLNIYIRMSFAYGRDFAFRVENRPEGGGRIEIGGIPHGAAD